MSPACFLIYPNHTISTSLVNCLTKALPFGHKISLILGHTITNVNQQSACAERKKDYMNIAAHIAVVMVTLGLIAASTVVAAGHNRRRALIPIKTEH